MCDSIRKIKDEFQILPSEKQTDVRMIEQVADEVRINFSQTSYPVNVEFIASKEGFKIFQGNLSSPELSAKIAIDIKLEDTFGTTKLILVNKNDTTEHQNFALAHVFAHYVFDYADNDEPYFNTYRTDEVYSDMDFRANRFAAALLMPREIFIAQYEAMDVKNMTVYDIRNELGKIFVASPEAVRRRFIELKIDY